MKKFIPSVLAVFLACTFTYHQVNRIDNELEDIEVGLVEIREDITEIRGDIAEIREIINEYLKTQ